MEFNKEKNFSSFTSNRRFGVEIEINALDLLSKPIHDKQLPDGIDKIACVINETLKKNVIITKWQNDHYNSSWGLKPDSSCGIEIISPVLKGICGIDEVSKVADAIRKNKFPVDKRCSVHVHVDVSDLTDEKLLSILTWWIKCEAVFFDCVLDCRKRNSYCMMIGLSKLFKVDTKFYNLDALMNSLTKIKYYSLNTYHKFNNKRNTIEFRIMDYDACKNSDDISNWIKLILHFCECMIERGMPQKYCEHDYLSGYYWVDPIQFMEILKMLNNTDISDELVDVKNWFLNRCYKNCNSYSVHDLDSNESRSHAMSEIKSMLK